MKKEAKEMISKMIKSELLYLTPCIIIFDILAFAISIPLIGFTYSMAFGLLLGTVVLYINLIQLGISTENAVNRYEINKSEKNSKAYMFANFLIRYLVIGLAIYLSFSSKLGHLFNTVGVVLPLFYPRLIYLIKSFRKGD